MYCVVMILTETLTLGVSDGHLTITCLIITGYPFDISWVIETTTNLREWKAIGHFRLIWQILYNSIFYVKL
jgi:hypothetical protein